MNKRVEQIVAWLESIGETVMADRVRQGEWLPQDPPLQPQQELRLSVHSDDCHNAELLGASEIRWQENYHPFEVSIEVGGELVAARMEYEGGDVGTVCTLLLPPEAKVTVKLEGGREDAPVAPPTKRASGPVWP